MLLIPAMELKNGQCLRSGDPGAAARRWIACGARRLHVTDLDSAATGKPPHAAALRAITEACGGVPVQVSGGLLTEEAVSACFEAGASYVVLGARALSAPHFVNDLCLEYPGRILVRIEVREGRLAAEGWSKFAQHDALQAAAHFQREGAAAIVCAGAGAQSRANGADVETALRLAQAVAIPVLVAGLNADLEEVRRLCHAGGETLGGAILGSATSGADFAQAQKLADSLRAGT